MIDPANVHFYDADLKTKEEFLLFSIFVAGKTAKIIARKVDDFLQDVFKYVKIMHNCTPDSIMEALRLMDGPAIYQTCKRNKIGKYNTIPRCLIELSQSNIDIENCTPEQLEQFPGIGPKTARYFIMYTQKGKQYAALDTHILKWLRNLGYDAPKILQLARNT